MSTKEVQNGSLRTSFKFEHFSWFFGLKRLSIASSLAISGCLQIQLAIFFRRLERELIGVKGVKTPAGIEGKVRPRRSVCDEEAHRPPAESEMPGTQINTHFRR
ncbi:hypothetical protein ACQKL0_16540 [Peribacillus sp. NPDC097264]|uniref:hypothetical protein n=1 Tax=unclassified Peribacillus TaxID=2675266 RepID=UPI0037F152AF